MFLLLKFRCAYRHPEVTSDLVPAAAAAAGSAQVFKPWVDRVIIHVFYFSNVFQCSFSFFPTISLKIKNQGKVAVSSGQAGERSTERARVSATDSRQVFLTLLLQFRFCFLFWHCKILIFDFDFWNARSNISVESIILKAMAADSFHSDADRGSNGLDVAMDTSMAAASCAGEVEGGAPAGEYDLEERRGWVEQGVSCLSLAQQQLQTLQKPRDISLPNIFNNNINPNNKDNNTNTMSINVIRSIQIDPAADISMDDPDRFSFYSCQTSPSSSYHSPVCGGSSGNRLFSRSRSRSPNLRKGAAINSAGGSASSTQPPSTLIINLITNF